MNYISSLPLSLSLLMLGRSPPLSLWCKILNNYQFVSFSNQIQKAHMCTFELYEHRLYSALAADTLPDHTVVRLGDIRSYLPKYVHNFLTQHVDKRFELFKHHYQVNTFHNETSNFIQTKFPYAYRFFIEEGFIASNHANILSKDNNIMARQIIDQEHTYFTDMLTDRSYGHYVCFSFWYITRSLLRNQCPDLFVFPSSSDTSTLPGFWDKFKSITGIYVYESNDDVQVKILKDYVLSGFGANLRHGTHRLLWEHLSIQSEKNFDITLPATWFTYNKKAFTYYFNALRVTRNLFLRTFPVSNVSNLFSKHLPSVAIVNRDSTYVGHNQPWRDSEINKYSLLITKLLESHYSVLRMNSSAIPLNISNHNLLDLSSTPSTYSDQFSLYGLVDFQIGTLTGATEHLIQSYSVPTLCVDSALMYTCGLAHKVVHMPKRLFIDSHSTFISTALPFLLTFIFSSQWTPESCNMFGLNIKALDSQEIYEGSFRFVRNKGNYLTYPSVYELLAQYPAQPTFCDAFIDDSTYFNIQYILDEWFKSKLHLE